MKVRLIIRDADYCRALTDFLSMSDCDMMIEIGDVNDAVDLDDRTMIITDYPYDCFNEDEICDFRKRTVFLTLDDENMEESVNESECLRIFKYDNISSILSEIEQFYYKWTGETGSVSGISAKVYSVCSDYGDFTEQFSRTLARQIVFRFGGNILLISMKYVNSFGSEAEKDRTRFSKMMYYMDIGRDFPIEAFTYRDPYGISYLRLPYGLNPVAYMSPDSIFELVKTLGNTEFSTIIFDMGNSFSESAVRLINKSDRIFYFEHEIRRFSIDEIIIDPDMMHRTEVIRADDSDSDIELIIDDRISGIYEKERPENKYEKKGSSKKVFRRN